MSFSERLSKMMEERHETNYRLAKELGVHQTTVANWKAGVKPQLAHLGLIASHFACTVDDLLREDA